MRMLEKFNAKALLLLPKFRIELFCLAIGVAVILSFYVCGYIYVLLLGAESSLVTPLTWFVAFYSQVRSYWLPIPLHHWTPIIISGLIPPFLICYYQFVYKKFGNAAVKWLIFSILVLLCWSWLSGIAFFFLTTHKLLWPAPLMYIQKCFNPYVINVHQSLINAGIIGGIVTMVLSLFCIKTKIPNIYGDAHFANEVEAKKAGLFAANGIILGKSFDRYLYMDGYEHVTLFSPSGSGKTVSLTIPNLLNWTGSSVVSDVKLTLFEHTSAYRQAIGQKVFLWNPGSPEGKTHCYNPLDVISANPHTRIDDIQKIAAIFIPDNPKSEPIWQVQSRFLFVALVLYVLDTKDVPKNIGEVVKIVKSQKNFAAFAEHVIATREDIDQLCKYNFMKFAELHEKTRLSILATFQSYFELFDNPLIAAATSRSDFDIRSLRREPMTIYVGVTNDNLVRLAPLLTVFYQQVADVLTRKMPSPDEPQGVLFLMDEFSALRRMESFHKNIGLYREYKIRVVIIIQELSQLYDTYGRDGAKVFINAKIRIAFTQNDEETCRLLESMLGNKTVLVKNLSRKLNFSALDTDHRTEASQYVSRPLMAAQDIRLMPEDKEVIFVQGHSPIYANKIMWFKDEQFIKRMIGSIPIPSILPYLESEEFKKTHVVIVDSSTAKESSVAQPEVVAEVVQKQKEKAKQEKESLESDF